MGAGRFAKGTSIQNTTELPEYLIFLPLVSLGLASETTWNRKLHRRQTKTSPEEALDCSSEEWERALTVRESIENPGLFLCFPSFLPRSQAVSDHSDSNGSGSQTNDQSTGGGDPSLCPRNCRAKNTGEFL